MRNGDYVPSRFEAQQDAGTLLQIVFEFGLTMLFQLVLYVMID
jgi:hypothetical protein